MHRHSIKTRAPIVIVGCRRSGTTLLRTILEGHPDLLVHPDEPQFFLELYRRYGFSKMNAKSAVEHVLDHPYHAPNVHAQAFSGAGSKLDLIELARLYVDDWKAGQGKKRLVLKHPQLVFHLEAVSRLFPGCTIINIIRDPRANVSSQRTRWPQFSVWTCAMYWRNAVRAAGVWGARHPERYLSISYEALVQDPEPTVRRLCDGLCLSFTERLLTFRQSEVMFGPGGSTQIKEFTAPDPSHKDLWKQRLSREDVQLIEYCCAQEMAELGYDPVTAKKLSLPLQLRRFREQIAYRFYTAGKQIKNAVRRLHARLQSYFLS